MLKIIDVATVGGEQADDLLGETQMPGLLSQGLPQIQDPPVDGMGECGFVQVGAEFGDALDIGTDVDVDADVALAGASDKFAARIRNMEADAAATGRSLAEYSLEELDALWERAKSTESS